MMQNAAQVLAQTNENECSISEVVLLYEQEQTLSSRAVILEKCEQYLCVMEKAAMQAQITPSHTVGDLISGDANRLASYAATHRTICGETLVCAMAKALSCSEVNASMGRICAAPTAGACGILPAALFSVGERFSLPRAALVQGLLTAAGVGLLIERNASISGAAGGCQAECGSAAAMAAAAIVEMLGGAPQAAFDAAAIALKNVMGLVCDPVAGLVESPCAKRNASGVANAMVSAELALAGIKSVIPFDETVGAMKAVGDMMSPALKETAAGGIAATRSAGEIAKRLFDF